MKMSCHGKCMEELLQQLKTESTILENALKHSDISKLDQCKFKDLAKKYLLRRTVDSLVNLEAFIIPVLTEPLYDRWFEYSDIDILAITKAKDCKHCCYHGLTNGAISCDYCYITGHRREGRPEFCDKYTKGRRKQLKDIKPVIVKDNKTQDERNVDSYYSNRGWAVEYEQRKAGKK